MKIEKELSEQITKHSAKMKKVFKKIELAEKGRDFESLLKIAHAYYKDSLYFFEKKKLVQAFEALIISWTYIDSGLRLRIFSLPEELMDYFTA